MWEFDDQVHGGPNALSEWVNISALDPEVNYCGVAWLTASSNSQFSFDLVDCDGTTEAYRVCYREPKNCSATSQPNGTQCPEMTLNKIEKTFNKTYT